MKQPELDYEVKGVIEQYPVITGAMFVLAAIITAVTIYFAIASGDLMLIAVFAVAALICLTVGLAGLFVKFYWGDEQFTACQLGVKPETYKYADLENIMQEPKAITLIMKGGKKIVIPIELKGLGDFINQLKVFFNANAGQNEGITNT